MRAAYVLLVRRTGSLLAPSMLPEPASLVCGPLIWPFENRYPELPCDLLCLASRRDRKNLNGIETDRFLKDSLS
ncbi:UNVERIFIED_CONTAM: hypothetical protein K2H54_014810 [Gekko kuhli]